MIDYRLTNWEDDKQKKRKQLQLNQQSFIHCYVRSDGSEGRQTSLKGEFIISKKIKDKKMEKLKKKLIKRRSFPPNKLQLF